VGTPLKDHPEVPVEWLKDEWRERGQLKWFQLTASGCVGSCDVPNVVVVNSDAGSQWLGNITHFDQYRALIAWAGRSVEAGHLCPFLCPPWVKIGHNLGCMDSKLGKGGDG